MLLFNKSKSVSFSLAHDLAGRMVATVAYLLMGGNAAVWFTNIALAILLLALLVDWLTFALVSVIGMLLGVTLYLFIVYGFSIALSHLTEASAI